MRLFNDIRLRFILQKYYQKSQILAMVIQGIIQCLLTKIILL